MTMSQLQDQLEGLPGYGLIMDTFNDYAEQHFNKLDPFEDEDGNKRKLSPKASKEDQKLWKEIRRKTWTHDRCFIGSCGIGLDCGLGLVPLVVLIPVLGPLLMYVVHLRLMSIVEKKYPLPSKLTVKLNSNIVLDLILTFPPLIGSFFGWLHGCSTRNAGLIYQYLEYVVDQKSQQPPTTYLGATRDIIRQPQFAYPPTNMENNQVGKDTGRARKKKKTKGVIVDEEQEMGYL